MIGGFDDSLAYELVIPLVAAFLYSRIDSPNYVTIGACIDSSID